MTPSPEGEGGISQKMTNDDNADHVNFSNLGHDFPYQSRSSPYFLNSNFFPHYMPWKCNDLMIRSSSLLQDNSFEVYMFKSLKLVLVLQIAVILLWPICKDRKWCGLWMWICKIGTEGNFGIKNEPREIFWTLLRLTLSSPFKQRHLRFVTFGQKHEEEKTSVWEKILFQSRFCPTPQSLQSKLPPLGSNPWQPLEWISNFSHQAHSSGSSHICLSVRNKVRNRIVRKVGGRVPGVH